MSETKTTWRVEFRSTGHYHSMPGAPLPACRGAKRWCPEHVVYDSRESAQCRSNVIRNTYAEETRIIRIETREFVEEER